MKLSRPSTATQGVRFVMGVLLCVAPLSSALASLELTEVDLFTGDIEITNIGNTPLGGASLESCVPFLYGFLESGTFEFAPGEVRTYNLGFALNAADDLWIYLDRTGSFADTSKVISGVVWGSDQSGLGRVNSVVTNTMGDAWSVNTDFVDTSGIMAGQTLQLLFPGDAPNMSSGWTVDASNLGTFGAGVPTCDFDGDGVCDLIDIDALCSEVASGTNNLIFDLTGDGNVDFDDCDEWLVQAGAENLPSGNPYIRGDANLDGVVDVSDFGVWNANKFTTEATYSQGDFNCDGLVDISDFNQWNSNKFTSSGDTAVVPEPRGLLLFGLGLLGLIRRRRSSRASLGSGM